MENQTIEILKKSGAILTGGHFVGTSGKHFDTYINKDALYTHPQATSEIGKLFAQHNGNLEINVVAAPALGGIILSTWTAYHLSELKNKEILSVYTEKDADQNQIFKRGYDKVVQGKNVLVLEDLTTTGGSVKKTIETVRQAGGNILRVCVMVNKDPKAVTQESVGAPFSSLAELPVTVYDELDCPLCKNNIPVNTEVGHGKKFLAEKK